MLFLFTLLVLSHAKCTSATPASFPPRSGLIDSFDWTSSNQVCHNQRSVWEITWSCLSTIFVCSWVAVHPNVLAPGTRPSRIALHRLELMFWTIIAPEMMIMWAMRQWFGARSIAKRYQGKGWTMAHGHFIQMGGFMLINGHTAQGVISPERLEELMQDARVEFPTITADEIEDRSKGNALSKTIAIGQTTWFIACCAVRKVQGLSITELELVTLAFAVLNGIMYFFWWHKPLDVRTCVPVYLSNTVAPTEAAKETKDVLIIIAGHGHGGNRATLRWIPESLCSRSITAISTILRRLGHMSSSSSVLHRDAIRLGRPEIPSFYASEPSEQENRIIVLVVAVIGIIFGGIHCIAWYFSFPTGTETTLWRVASLIVTFTPFILAVGYVILYLSACFSDILALLLKFLAPSGTVVMSAAVVGFPLYSVARLLLLAEAFIALRDLPPTTLIKATLTPI